jgi:hypothetical protein
MEDLGVGDQYLLLKTAPFSLVESDLADWENILAGTKTYREKLLALVMSTARPKLLIADGRYAAVELDRILEKILGRNSGIQVVRIDRETGAGARKDSGIKAVASLIPSSLGFNTSQVKGKMADIPRSHLSYYARVWEGTSGDRVLTSTDSKFAGKAFAEVAPKWAYTQRFDISESDKQGIQALNQKIENARVRKGRERIGSFLERIR